MPAATSPATTTASDRQAGLRNGDAASVPRSSGGNSVENRSTTAISPATTAAAEADQPKLVQPATGCNPSAVGSRSTSRSSRSPASPVSTSAAARAGPVAEKVAA